MYSILIPAVLDHILMRIHVLTSNIVYYSVENSLNIANELLLYQFQNDEKLLNRF